jgi:short-chain fatty acids transporter
MMKRVVNFFTKLCAAYLPDAYVFSVLLTLVVFILAWIFTPFRPVELVEFWGRDFWSLNGFAMQMVFVLISGHLLARTELASGLLKSLAGRVKNQTQGLIVLSLFSSLACLINWGLGLVVSGVLALELARRLKQVNFALFVSTAYASFILWHGGLSGSIPLKIAGQDEVVARVFGPLSIPLEQTIFSNWNLILILSLFTLLPIFALAMAAGGHRQVVCAMEETKIEGPMDHSFRSRLENSKTLNFILFVGLAAVIILGFLGPTSLDINRVNLIFLSLAILLHKTPQRFLKAFAESFPYAGGIVIQFPFYAGIMGLMQYSGLADRISELFVQISTKDTLPFFSFLSAGVVNFFIPSGGGQWVVQGPIMLKAAKHLGADPSRVSMALAWGDAWTNLIQPFWALPILALAKLELKDIMGYCLLFTLGSGVVISLLLVLI